MSGSRRYSRERAELKDTRVDKATDILARIRYFRETRFFAILAMKTWRKRAIYLDLQVSTKEKTIVVALLATNLIIYRR